MIDMPLGNFIPLEISTYFNLRNRLDAALLSTVRREIGILISAAKMKKKKKYEIELRHPSIAVPRSKGNRFTFGPTLITTHSSLTNVTTSESRRVESPSVLTVAG